MGDVVTVKECRPISKSKTWVLISDKDMTDNAASPDENEIAEEGNE